MRLDSLHKWQCGHCKQWVGGCYMHHIHATQVEATMAEMLAQRAAMEAGLEGIVPDPFEKTATVTYWRTGKEPTKEVDNG